MNTFQLELVSCMAAHGTDLMSSARKGRIPDPLDFYQSISIQISNIPNLPKYCAILDTLTFILDAGLTPFRK